MSSSAEHGARDHPRRLDGPDLSALEARIRKILRTPGVEQDDLSAVPTGWPEADAALGGGLARGALHEWSGVEGLRRASGPSLWTPPLYLAIHLTWQALESQANQGDALQRQNRTSHGRVLWIGREIWPYPRAMVRDFGLRASEDATPSRFNSDALQRSTLELVRWPANSCDDPQRLITRSLLVDADPVQKRLWAVDTALRCSSVTVVVADGSGFDMAATRRLQLAAEVGHGLGLLFRPPWEAKSLSAATSRWRVLRSAPVNGIARPRWSLELTRSKIPMKASSNEADLFESARES